MTDTALTPASISAPVFGRSGARALPLFGPLLAGPGGLVILAVLAILAVWGLAIGQFGLVALGLPMVAVTPVIFAVLIVIAAG